MIKEINSIIVTVISGVLVFIIGQILTHIWLNPLQQYKNLKKEIVYKLSYYANLYSNVIDSAKYDANSKLVQEYKKGSDELRILSCSLMGFAETLYWFRLGIPKPEVLHEVANLLMFLSNSFFSPHDSNGFYDMIIENNKAKDRIYKLLNCHYK